MTPVFLRGEIDDPPRPIEFHPGGDEHLPDLHFPGFAGRRILSEVFRKLLLEHQGDAFAHDPDGVHGVHDRVHAGFQQIAFCQLDHGLVIPAQFAR